MDIASAIANLGFPIGVAIYLLTRLEKKMESLDNSIKGKDGVIDKLDNVTEAIRINNKVTRRNYVGKVKGEKYV